MNKYAKIIIELRSIGNKYAKTINLSKAKRGALSSGQKGALTRQYNDSKKIIKNVRKTPHFIVPLTGNKKKYEKQLMDDGYYVRKGVLYITKGQYSKIRFDKNGITLFGDKGKERQYFNKKGDSLDTKLKRLLKKKDKNTKITVSSNGGLWRNTFNSMEELLLYISTIDFKPTKTKSAKEVREEVINSIHVATIYRDLPSIK